MRTIKAISHDESIRMVRAVQARLDERQLGAAVAVVDAHGELLAFLRTDGCRLLHHGRFPLTTFGELRYVTWGGGVPVRSDGEVVGAVGVSGLSEEEDLELAEMAAGLVSS